MITVARRRVAVAAAVVAVVCIGGCGGSGRSSGQASRNAEPPLSQQKFDLVDEPPINAETRFAAGQLAETRADWESAIRQYEAALKEMPRDERVIHRLAVAYTYTQQFPKAEGMWLRLVDVTGGSADAWNNLAQCYEYARRPTDAENAYRRAVSADGGNVFARTNYGLMLVRTGRVDEGREQMLAVLSPAEMHYNVASVFELQGNKTLARAEYLKALELDPQMADARKRLSAIEK